MPRAINTRRNTELGLLIAAAIPVILLYAMYLLNAKVALSFSSLAVPIGLFAAFAVALAEGETLRDAVEMAVCSGALACTRFGAREGLPRRAEVDALAAVVKQKSPSS